MKTEHAGPFRLVEGIHFAGLKAALARAGFTRDAIQKAGAMPTGTMFDMAQAMNSTAGGTPTGELIRLFMLGRTIDRAGLTRIVPRTLIESLERVGLLVSDGAGVRSIAALAPMYGTYVVRDFEHFITGRPLGPEHVLGTGLATTLLSKLTPRPRHDARRSPRRVLDLGTGQGFQAFLAAEDGDEVIGTDISARALNFAALGAAINGVRLPDFRLGSFYEPVASDARRPGQDDSGFDLIVSNPPFVVAPPSEMVYSSGSLTGDQTVEHVVRTAPVYLRDDGFAVFLGNWYHNNEHDWADKPKAWTNGQGCDAWLIRFSTTDPESYARNWIHELGLATPPDAKGDVDPAMLEHWMQYYDSIGARAITFGGVILRRRVPGLPGSLKSAPNWCREDSFPIEGLHDHAGDQVVRIFENTTLVKSIGSPRSLMDLVLTLNPDHELEQQCRLEPSEGENLWTWTPTRASLRQTRGFAMTVSVDGLVMRVLQGWDGRRAAGETIRTLAEEMGANEADALAQSGTVAARMLEQGHLVVKS